MDAAQEPIDCSNCPWIKDLKNNFTIALVALIAVLGGLSVWIRSNHEDTKTLTAALSVLDSENKVQTSVLTALGKQVLDISILQRNVRERLMPLEQGYSDLKMEADRRLVLLNEVKACTRSTERPPTVF